MTTGDRRSSSFLRTLTLAASLAAGVLLSPAASAQDKALAESLFQAGKQLMNEGKFDQACPKFLESNKQDPSPGTLLNLGKCYEAQGKTSSAWAEYKNAASQARSMGRNEQEQAASERAAALEPKLSKLKIDAPAEAIPGLVVKRDGVSVGAGSLGLALPVDPGEHTIEASAPGYKTWTGKITLGKDADSKSLAIPALEKAPEPPAGEGAGVGQPGGPAGPGGGPDTGGGSSRKTIGFVVAGVGVVSLGVGAIMGVMASGQASDAENDKTLCPNKVCTKAGRDEIDGAETKALISTIGFGVGIAAVGAGVVLILTAPSAKTASAAHAPVARVVPSVGPQGGGLSFVGAF